MSAGDERNGRNRGTTLPFGMILIFGFLPGGGCPKGLGNPISAGTDSSGRSLRVLK
jgi:hypothetical protein